MLATMICISLMIIFPQSAQSFLDVGGDYGASWLKEHGEEPKIEETRNNLWNWGSAPKGFEIYNGTVYPPGYAPSDRKSTRLNSSHIPLSRMPSSA